MLKICLVKLLFTASNFIVPFSTLFVSKHYGFDAGVVASLVTLLSIGYLLGNLSGGYLGDKFDSKPLLVGLSLASFASMLVGTLASPVTLTFAAILLFASLAGAASPILSNYLSSRVDDGNRERAFGNLYLAHNLGIAVVFIVGGFLLDRGTLYPLSVFTVLCALCSIATLLLLETGRRREAPMAGRAPKTGGPSRMAVLIACSFALFFALAFLDAQREYQLPIWLDSWNSGSSATWFGTIGIVNAVVVLALTSVTIKLTSRFAAIINMGFAAVFYGIGFGLHALCDSIYPVLALVVLWSIGEILGATYMNVFISKYAPPDYRAKLFSLIPVLLTLGKILSIGTSTHVAAGYGIDAPWLLALGVGAMAAVFAVAINYFTDRAYAHDEDRHSPATL